MLNIMRTIFLELDTKIDTISRVPLAIPVTGAFRVFYDFFYFSMERVLS